MLVSRDAKLMEDTSTVGGTTVAIMRSLLKIMVKQQIRSPHSSMKRTTKMGDLRRKKTLRLATNDTNGPSHSKKRLKCLDLNDRVDINRLKKCQLQLKTLKLRMLWIQWEKCRLLLSRRWNQTTQLNGKKHAIWK